MAPLRLRRLLVRLAVAIAVAPVAFFVAGYATTLLLAGDGRARFAGEERDIASLAVARAQGCGGENPIERAWLPRRRIVDLRLEPRPCPIAGDPRRAYRVEVRIYTLFAIPVRAAVVDCATVECQRLDGRGGVAPSGQDEQGARATCASIGTTLSESLRLTNGPAR